MEATSLYLTIFFGLLSILLTVYIFIRAKDTEKNTTVLLTEINLQVAQFQKLTARWLDKSIDYFTQPHPVPLDNSLNIISQITESIILKTNSPNRTNNNKLDAEAFTSLTVQLCYYLAKTNYYAQGYLPSINNINQQDNFIKITCDTIDTTYTQFHALYKSISDNYNPKYYDDEITDSLYQEIKTSWLYYVKTSSDILIAKSSVTQ